MTQNPMNPPMDWYPDPADPSRERYWDGERWTHNTRPMKPVAMGIPTQNGMHAPFQDPQPRDGQAPYGQAPNGQPLYGQPVAPPQFHQGGIMVDARSLTADGVPLAGWWVRFFAMILDSLICGLIASLFAFGPTARLFHAVRAYTADAASSPLPGASSGDPLTMLGPYGVSAADLMTIGLASTVVSLLYSLLLLRFRGATLGQTILGIRVVPTGQGQAPRGLGWSSAIRRVLVFGLLNDGINLPVVGSLLLILCIISCLMPLAHPRRQTLHDLAAGTQVVRTR